MVILLHGEDTYRSRERLRVLREAFRSKYDAEGLSMVRVDAAETEPARVRGLLVNTGLFGGRRLVVVERVSDAGLSVQDAMLPALAEVAQGDAVIALVWEPRSIGGGASARGRRRPTKAAAAKRQPLAELVPKARVELFEPLIGPQLAQWYRGYAKRLGYTLTVDAVTELVQRVGADLWAGSAALDKLNSARVGTEVDATLVAENVPAQVPPAVFALTDAVAERRTDLALQLLEQELAHGAPPLALLSQLTRQFRVMVQMGGSTGTPATLAKRFGVHPYVAQKAAAAARRFTPSELTSRFVELLDLERKLKSSHPNPALLLERFVFRARARPTPMPRVRRAEATQRS